MLVHQKQPVKTLQFQQWQTASLPPHKSVNVTTTYRKDSFSDLVSAYNLYKVAKLRINFYIQIFSAYFFNINAIIVTEL